MVDIKVINGELDEKELEAYLAYGRETYTHREIKSMEVTLDGEFVDLKYTFKEAMPFQRIRRITGYLVGTTERWNDAKRAEEADRVKHSAV
ncbi:MAG TPA: hypothetical protein DIC60_10065 [Lachnospiraceae bacterium]|nr:hypothetical protein [Lachnospiraceae bacterium]